MAFRVVEQAEHDCYQEKFIHQPFKAGIGILSLRRASNIWMANVVLRVRTQVLFTTFAGCFTATGIAKCANCYRHRDLACEFPGLAIVIPPPFRPPTTVPPASDRYDSSRAASRSSRKPSIPRQSLGNPRASADCIKLLGQQIQTSNMLRM